VESNYIAYDFLKSFDRIDDILSGSDTDYNDANSIPARSQLTFRNGFYVNCSALFVDIRKSSELAGKYKRPTLAKLYRAYVSECVAVASGSELCAEVSIVGDCVSGVFDTPDKANINEVFSLAARLASLVKTLNYKLRMHNIDPIAVGIGVAYGRALMTKAGYSGSQINDVVWIGEVVNDASHLAAYANSSRQDKEVMVSRVFYHNLDDKNKGLLELNTDRDCYQGNVINLAMEAWYDTNCKD
jgi:class 3 adenylate cyclase